MLMFVYECFILFALHPNRSSVKFWNDESFKNGDAIQPSKKKKNIEPAEKKWTKKAQ